MKHADTTAQPVLKPAVKVSDTLCISIRRLTEAVRVACNNGSDLAAFNACYGLNFIRGYVIDDTNNDIVLYGDSIENRPPIFLDDISVCVQNVWHPQRFRYTGHQYPSPFCSLDPRKGAMGSVDLVMRGVDASRLENSDHRQRMIERLEAALGPQEARVGGVPRDARLAHVMIDADYHMKKVSQGHLILSGVESCSRIGLEQQRAPAGLLASIGRVIGFRHSPRGSSMSRFWFHLDKNHPTFFKTNGIVEIDDCTMVVLTERQVSAQDGSLLDGGGDDLDAQAFAGSMSKQLRRNATCVKEYADLENMYRLFALLKAIQFSRAETAVNLDVNPLLEYVPKRIEMPNALPALANIETEIEETPGAKRWYCSLVCGGVSMDVLLTPRRFKANRDGRLANTKQWIVRSRPDARSVFWYSHVFA